MAPRTAMPVCMRQPTKRALYVAATGTTTTSTTTTTTTTTTNTTTAIRIPSL